MAHASLPSKEELQKHFEYDTETETLYRRRIRIEHKRKIGYPCIFLNGKNYLAHRLVWTLHNGPIPKGMVIDHIDRNPLNYKLSNLRLVSYHQNNLNIPRPLKRPDQNITPKFNGWEVRSHVNGKRLYIGFFHSMEEARVARDKAHAQREELNRVVQSKAA